ncbi:PspA/IM30 family protein [Pseudomonas sp. TKO26]|uniref:Phage shock protein A (PspA) family protein n=1 Tax=Pseudomonas saponiphila TaxID=556534 RepID=A0A1H4XAZ7_9PSED|nr:MULTISPECIES: PspA/IM30 family protein [Pseudomonas]PYY90748.1 PspA/IM30 family protein [Pseudomonas sp. TKO30]PYY93620.1 PspA/IM30 family protein [Pseudomonas sp. TKO29]PYY95848.1 PspA/IM30 family protein [Pseudomonas sp. TKO26]PYZ01779.1 PspA/IM30 family protein [Pseudomonas sp. TKO14]SED02783.1 phage shock protein A (PspA) family protein [Pseudomonas saponiphila]
MNVWSKLLTALRGGANEAGEALVDSQALRILDQEIRDADQELRKSKEALAEIMARQKLAAERADSSAAKVAEYESYALKALESGNEQLAQEVAQKIANLENDLAIEREQADGFAASVAQLRKAVTQAEGNIKHLKQQVDTVKATESVQKAQQAVAQRYGGSQSKLHTAVESLERIKQKQAERAAKMEAAAELASTSNPDDALDAKLREAGIVAGGTSADSVLARLKDRSKS